MKKIMLGVALGTILLAAPLSAQNLLTNSEFTTNLSGWTATGNGLSSYNAGVGTTALGGADLGCDFGQSITLSQCVNVTALSLYDLTVDTHTNAGGGSNGVQVRFFAGAGCTGTDLGVFPTNSNGSVPSPVDGQIWTRRTRAAQAAPATSVSARVELFVSVPAQGRPPASPLGDLPARVYFDHAFFGAAGTPVTLQTIDAE